MMDSSDPLIRSKDFESLKVSVAMTNLTSGDKRVIAGSLEELRDDGCVVGCPKRTAAQNHTILVEITHAAGRMKATSRVTESEDVEGGDQSRLTLVFVQFEAREFEALKQLYAKRQSEILELMTAMKGY